MDPHFHEYLAAVAGMHELYGEQPCDGSSEFHAEQAEVTLADVVASVSD